MEGARVVRGVVLRARRYGEPHQGTVLVVRWWGERGNEPREPEAVVLVSDGLGVGERATTAGLESDGTGTSSSGNDSHQTAQDWSSGTRHGAEGVGIDGFQLSLARPLSAGVVEPALLKRHCKGQG